MDSSSNVIRSSNGSSPQLAKSPSPIQAAAQRVYRRFFGSARVSPVPEGLGEGEALGTPRNKGSASATPSRAARVTPGLDVSDEGGEALGTPRNKGSASATPSRAARVTPGLDVFDEGGGALGMPRSKVQGSGFSSVYCSSSPSPSSTPLRNVSISAFPSTTSLKGVAEGGLFQSISPGGVPGLDLSPLPIVEQKSEFRKCVDDLIDRGFDFNDSTPALLSKAQQMISSVSISSDDLQAYEAYKAGMIEVLENERKNLSEGAIAIEEMNGKILFLEVGSQMGLIEVTPEEIENYKEDLLACRNLLELEKGLQASKVLKGCERIIAFLESRSQLMTFKSEHPLASKFHQQILNNSEKLRSDLFSSVKKDLNVLKDKSAGLNVLPIHGLTSAIELLRKYRPLESEIEKYDFLFENSPVEFLMSGFEEFNEIADDCQFVSQELEECASKILPLLVLNLLKKEHFEELSTEMKNLDLFFKTEMKKFSEKFAGVLFRYGSFLGKFSGVDLTSFHVRRPFLAWLAKDKHTTKAQKEECTQGLDLVLENFAKERDRLEKKYEPIFRELNKYLIQSKNSLTNFQNELVQNAYGLTKQKNILLKEIATLKSDLFKEKMLRLSEKYSVIFKEYEESEMGGSKIENEKELSFFLNWLHIHGEKDSNKKKCREFIVNINAQFEAPPSLMEMELLEREKELEGLGSKERYQQYLLSASIVEKMPKLEFLGAPHSNIEFSCLSEYLVQWAHETLFFKPSTKDLKKYVDRGNV